MALITTQCIVRCTATYSCSDHGQCWPNKRLLFHQKCVTWQDAGGVAAATMVGVPKKPLHLPTNYRTHSGILNAAAAVVDILKQYFPMVCCIH